MNSAMPESCGQTADTCHATQGFMKVGPALVRPDGKMVGACLSQHAGELVTHIWY